MQESIVLPILEPSQAGEARRVAIALADRLSFNETQRGKVAIVVTEVANNLVRYAREGLLLLHRLEQNRTNGIEIVSLDKGPGMSNISECLQDGFSTGGTPGNGLGAISRLSHLFDIHSVPRVGTALLAHLWAIPPTHPSKEKLKLGVVCLPKPGEDVSGDAWASECSSGRTLLLVVDGLGHGPFAAKAAAEAVQVFHQQRHRSPGEIVEMAHAALRSTRGAALAIAEIDLEQESVRFAGVGNIAGSVFWPAGSYSMVSHNGTVGHEVRKIQEFTYPWHRGGLLVMHSDGLGTQWRLERYAGLTAKYPSLIAGVLYRDFNRGRDDVTVLVAKEEVQ